MMMGEKQVVAMGGSKGGKHSKSKGKSKSKKPNATNQIPEPSGCKVDVAHILDNNPDGLKNSNKQHPQPNTSSSMTTSRSRYTEKELEEFLCIKLITLYNRAKSWLLQSGYSITEAEQAILNAGHPQGPMDLQNNILNNSIAFLENKIEHQRGPFNDMAEQCKSMVEFLVVSAMQARPNLQRSEAMWQLLVRNWGSLPPTTSRIQTGDQNSTSMLTHGSHASISHSRNEDVGGFESSSAVDKVPFESNCESSMKKVGTSQRVYLKPALVSQLRQNVPILAASLRRKIGASAIMQHDIPCTHGEPTEVPDIVSAEFLTSLEGTSYEACLRTCLEINSDDDPRTAVVADLVKDMRRLYAEVNERREWAKQKVLDSAKRLSKDFMDIMMLKLEKIDVKQLKFEKRYAEMTLTLKLIETEESVRNVNSEANQLTESVRRLELINAQIRADIEALKMNASESDKDMKIVLKRERKCSKKLAEIEKQRSIFQEQCEEEKQRVVQLELELLQSEKEAEEAEMERIKAIKEKEQLFALLAEETKIEETRKANSRAQLLKLHQKIEIDNQLARDERRRLEDELFSFRMSDQMSDVSLEDHIFSCNIEGTSSESGALDESYEKMGHHWKCMICMDKEVAVAFIPCTHEVVCVSCYEGSCKAIGQCPCCRVQIEQGIKVYGPCS